MRKRDECRTDGLRALPGPCGGADVALCIADLEQIPLVDVLDYLSRAELDRSQRHACDLQSAQTAKSRGLLRLMLAHFTGWRPESFEIVEGGGSAPRLLINPWHLYFNVSHSSQYALVAICRDAIGVDIERITPDCDWETVAANFFHPTEQEYLLSEHEDSSLEAFFEIWTRKEAYLKAKGTGVAEDLSAFSVMSPASAASAASPTPSLSPWYIERVNAPPGYKAALASQQPNPAVAYWELQLVFTTP